MSKQFRITTNKATRETRFYVDGRRVSMAYFFGPELPHDTVNIVRTETSTHVRVDGKLRTTPRAPFFFSG